MRDFFKIYILIFALTNIFVNKVFSQNQAQQMIKEIIKDYNALNYQQAAQKAKQALINYHQFTPPELVELHKYLALINYAQGKIDESKKNFEAALSLNPDLVLSPLYVSPKIIEFFNKIKAELNSEAGKIEELSLRYILVRNKKFNASLRSIVLPGWGQIYKGEKKKGIVLVSLWTSSVGGLLVTHLKQSKAREVYLDAKESDEIESKYNDYNNYYKARNYLAIFSLALWLYAHIDAAIKKVPDSSDFSHHEGDPILFPQFRDHQILLTCQWNLEKLIPFLRLGS